MLILDEAAPNALEQVVQVLLDSPRQVVCLKIFSKNVVTTLEFAKHDLSTLVDVLQRAMGKI